MRSWCFCGWDVPMLAIVPSVLDCFGSGIFQCAWPKGVSEHSVWVGAVSSSGHWDL